MAITINKQRLLQQLLTSSRKGADAEATARPVLEQFIYGLCREDATPEQADRAYRYLQDHFFDWNEVRVSSTREVEEAFEDMSDAEARATRLIAFLQEVFETDFSFDLENLQKKGLKQAAKQLARYQASDDFVASWVIQRSLGGHAIPLDAPTLRCTHRLGLIDQADDLEAARNSLEHLVPKVKGPHFGDRISQVAGQHCHDEEPRCGSCPLAGDCGYALEHGVERVAAGRTHRPKPR